MRTFIFVLIGLVAGYAVAAVATYFLVMEFSPNIHDRGVEAPMTAAFVGGPIGAIVGAIAGWALARRP